MVTTPPCRFWPAERRSQVISGPMCAMIARSEVCRSRLRYTFTRVIAPAGIRAGISHSGILQADAYAGFNDLYAAGRKPAPITEAACWSHGRRNLFKLAEIAKAPLAIEAVRRIDAIFDVEREINGLLAVQRHTIRQTQVAPLVTSLEQWMRAERGRLSRHADVAKAMNYMLKRWDAFTRFLDDGRICLTNNAAERALRRVALGRKSWLFAG